MQLQPGSIPSQLNSLIGEPETLVLVAVPRET